MKLTHRFLVNMTLENPPHGENQFGEDIYRRPQRKMYNTGNINKWTWYNSNHSLVPWSSSKTFPQALWSKAPLALVSLSSSCFLVFILILCFESFPLPLRFHDPLPTWSLSDPCLLSWSLCPLSQSAPSSKIWCAPSFGALSPLAKASH